MPFPWLAAAGIGVDLLGSVLGSNSAAKANRTNIMLQRENREWQERMANSEMQRRVEDLKKAGLNPVLAAHGAGASSPSVSSATVEPTFRSDDLKGTVARTLMLQAQLENTRANTAAQAAEARSKNVEADIREKLRDQEQETRANRFVEQREWDDLRTRILRNQDVSSAAEGERLRRTVDAMVQKAQQDARVGKLDLDALENIAKIGGLEASKSQGILKMILDLYRASHRN